MPKRDQPGSTDEETYDEELDGLYLADAANKKPKHQVPDRPDTPGARLMEANLPQLQAQLASERNPERQRKLKREIEEIKTREREQAKADLEAAQKALESTTVSLKF